MRPQSVLKALLPESGTDIKGQMRSRQELLEASDYGNRPRDFDDLIHILDPELRLITPTDPEEKDEGGRTSARMKDEGGRVNEERASASDSSFIVHPSSFRYYQLAHDYLVHSLRDWLTRKAAGDRPGTGGAAVGGTSRPVAGESSRTGICPRGGSI